MPSLLTLNFCRLYTKTFLSNYSTKMMLSSTSKIIQKPPLPLVVVLGATGAGKSKLAIEIAKAFSGEVISADSMQVYKGLDILTNKVTPEEEKECKHHLIGYLDSNHKNHTVIDFKNAAIPIIENLQKQNKLPVICGGTNYYIESLLWDFTLDNDDVSVKPESNADNTISVAPDLVLVNNEDGKFEEELLRQVFSLRSEPPTKIQSELEDLSPSEVYWCLQQIDPETAAKNHPKNTRKIIRAIHHYLVTGKTLSSTLKDQHQGQSQVKSGPLRYPNTCILWVKCNQLDLDRRTDKRVGSMLQRGMVAELEEFCKVGQEFIEQTDNMQSYPQGFLQNIGFKEFRKYLLLNEDERKSSKGEKCLEEGLENLKQVTRKYARKQVKWITNRFCSRPGPNVPKVYSVDSTDVSKWDEAVKEAISVVHAFYQGEAPTKQPETPRSSPTQFERNVCQVCNGIVCLTVHDWEAHTASKSHKYNVKKLKKEHSKLTTILDARKAELAENNIEPGEEILDGDS